MKTVTDVTCHRCKNTTSVQADQGSELVVVLKSTHACVDGFTGNVDFTVSGRTVLGPGEKGETTRDAG